MAGVKGMKGGGGKRQGAGRPPNPPVTSVAEGGEAEAFLRELIADKSADARLRLEAAKALIAYQKPKMGEAGKKDAKKEAAQAASARFSIPTPPKLTLVKSA